VLGCDGYASITHCWKTTSRMICVLVSLPRHCLMVDFGLQIDTFLDASHACLVSPGSFSIAFELVVALLPLNFMSS